MHRYPRRLRGGLVSATIALALWAGALLAAGDAAADDWRVGVARGCITPDQSMPMCGYGPCMSEGVLDDLFAHALALEWPGGQRAVLVTADLLFFRAPVADAVCRRIADRTGLQRAQILLNASHTHAGPIVGITKDLDHFEVPAAARPRVAAYVAKLEEQLADLVAEALTDLQPARLAWGVGQAEFVANRRLATPQGIVMAPNPAGHVDRDVPVLLVTAPSGKWRAVIFGCACHNVTLDGQNRKLSGDYAGWAQREIESRYPGVQALFLAGCGGNANPQPRGGPHQEQLVRRHGQRLAQEVCRVAQGTLQPVRGPLRPELHWTELPLDHELSADRLRQLAAQTSWHARNAQVMLQRRERGDSLPTHYRTATALWQFGSDLTLVGLPGEAMSEYVSLLRGALGPERLWVAAYCYESFGYLPTKIILQEGGHETMGLTLDTGFFAPAVEEVVVTTVRQLARQAGRIP